MSDESAEHQMAKAMQEFSAMMAPLLEATSGYRRQCEAAGYSPTAAEQMALSFHGVLIAQLMGSALKQGTP